MYRCLYGMNPFCRNDDNEQWSHDENRAVNANYNLNINIGKKISKDAKSLIRHLLSKNPKQRYSARSALNHRWFNLENEIEIAALLLENEIPNIRDEIEGYSPDQ